MAAGSILPPTFHFRPLFSQEAPLIAGNSSPRTPPPAGPVGGNAIATSAILGIDVARITTAEFIDLVAAAARERRRWRVCYVNAAGFGLAAHNARYAEALRSADLVYADGQAVVWASRRLGCPLTERVNAGDFFDRFCERCARDGLRLYFLGSQAGVAEAAARRLRASHPDLQITGARQGYFDTEESAAIIAGINRCAPDVLVVGMGAPRQELWVREHLDRLDVGVAWCVGALFEYLSGTRRRAPVWMRKAGLEWAFRLVLEPRRLWRRYLIGNCTFLWRVARARRER